jgi:hypothetical protein
MLYYHGIQQGPCPLGDTPCNMEDLCEAFCPGKATRAVMVRPRKTKELLHEGMARFLATMRQIDAANQLLAKRGLIRLAGETLYPQVALTGECCDLGRKYNCWFLSLGLWWSEYGGHCLIWRPDCPRRNSPRETRPLLVALRQYIPQKNRSPASRRAQITSVVLAASSWPSHAALPCPHVFLFPHARTSR